MKYILILIIVVLMSLQNILKKQYNIKNEEPKVFFFLALTYFSAMVFFVISGGFRLSFVTGLLPYSIGFALSSVATCVGTYYALKFGPLGITTFITSFSLLIPTLYGMVILKEQIGTMAYVGIALLVIALCMLNIKKEREPGEFSIRWLVFVLLAFFGSGMCSTVQKMQQLQFDRQYKSEFMVIALAIEAVALLTLSLVRKERIWKEPRRFVFYGILDGIANGGSNLLTMILTGLIANAILFPSISAGGLVLSFVLAVGLYKEKLSYMQMFGYAIGVVSIICLNI